jgi:hypothetical protein
MGQCVCQNFYVNLHPLFKKANFVNYFLYFKLKNKTVDESLSNQRN